MEKTTLLKKLWWGLLWIISLPIMLIIRAALSISDKALERIKTVGEFIILAVIGATLIYFGCLLS